MTEQQAPSDRATRSVTMAAAQEPLSDAAPPLSRSALRTKSDGNVNVACLRQRAPDKITGRRLRQPRKFVVTDLPDHDELFSTPTASPSKPSVEPARTGEDVARGPCVPTVSRRKGRMEVKGRFTIIDWSPDSPAASPFRHDLSVRTSKPESPRKRMLRKQLSSGSKLSAAAAPVAAQQPMGAVSYARERRMLSLDAPSATAAPPTPRANLHMFDNHLAFLEKESKEMKSTLESMVNTNAQWIEMLAKSGLNLAPECPAFQASEASVAEPTVPVVPAVPAATASHLAASIRRPSFDAKYHTLEMAYMELQKKFESAVRDKEKMEIKNILLETRLQQQVTRAESLRAQLEKLTRYTENLIGDYSEPNYTGYGSDMNSLFGEQSSVEVDEHSPTAVEMGSEYDFNYEALKDPEHSSSLRPRRRSDEDECISDTSSERDTSSGCEFVDNNQQYDSSRYFFDDDSRRPAGLTTADLSSLPAVMVDPGALLGESKTSTSLSSDDDDMMAPLSSPDDNQRTHEFPEQSPPNSLSKLSALKRQGSSFASLNMSTVSSTSSLASFGAQVAALSRSKDGSFTDLLAAAIAKQKLVDGSRSSEC